MPARSRRLQVEHGSGPGNSRTLAATEGAPIDSGWCESRRAVSSQYRSSRSMPNPAAQFPRSFGPSGRVDPVMSELKREWVNEPAKVGEWLVRCGLDPDQHLAQLQPAKTEADKRGSWSA